MVCLDLFLDFEGDCGFSIITGPFGSFGDEWETLRDDGFCVLCSITG
jgi:hypothetical protein